MRFSQFKNLYSFLKETVSEANGSASFGRMAAAAIVTFTLGWITYLVLKTHAMPDLAGPTLFLSSGTSATYGANKVAGVIAGRVDKSDPPVPPAVSQVPK
jgi:hypothetical protein